MARAAWVSMGIAVGAGVGGFGLTGESALAPLQFTSFLFAVLFLILLILGSPSLRKLV